MSLTSHKIGYYLAATDADYTSCSAMPEAAGMRLPPRDCPLVMATQGDVLLGWLGSWTDDDMNALVLGPLVTSADRKARGRLALRLLEAMERLLPYVGVTEYVFPVDRGREEWLRTLQRLFGHPLILADGTAWFRKSFLPESR